MKRLGVQFANGTCAVTPLPTDEDVEMAAQLCCRTPGWGTPRALHWMHTFDPALDPMWDAHCWTNMLDAHVGCMSWTHMLDACIGSMH